MACNLHYAARHTQWETPISTCSVAQIVQLWKGVGTIWLYYTLMSVSATDPTRMTIVRDPHSWDTLVASHRYGGFLQSWSWGRFKQHFGWAPVRVRLPGEPGEAPLAQVLFRRIPYSPFTLGYLPRGPLLNYADEGELDAMLCALDRIARRFRAVVITWELPMPDDSLLTARLARHHLRPAQGIQHRSTRVIDLSQPLDLIVAQQKPKWRSNTRLARKHGVQVRLASSLDDLANWYTLLQTTSTRDAFTVRGEEYYRCFWQSTVSSGDTVLLLAEHEGKLLAGIMVHRFGSEATYLYGASSEEGRNLMPNHLLQAEAMQWARERGATRYDLFGIADTDDPDEPLAGVTRFKAGFGGSTIHYAGTFDRVYHPLLYRVVQRARAGGLG